MDKVIDALFDQSKETHYLTREQFADSLSAWDIDPQHDANGSLACVWLTKDAQLHFATFGNGWKLTRDEIRKRLDPLIKRYGYAETFTPKEDTRQHRFNKALGFFVTREDDYYIHFRIERHRYA